MDVQKNRMYGNKHFAAQLRKKLCEGSTETVRRIVMDMDDDNLINEYLVHEAWKQAHQVAKHNQENSATNRLFRRAVHAS